MCVYFTTSCCSAWGVDFLVTPYIRYVRHQLSGSRTETRRSRPFSRGRQRGCRRNGQDLQPHQAAPPSARGSLRLYETSQAQTPPQFPTACFSPRNKPPVIRHRTRQVAQWPTTNPVPPKPHVTLPFRRAESGKTSILLEMQLSRLRTQLAWPMRSLPSSTGGQARLLLPTRPCRRVPAACQLHRRSSSKRLPLSFLVVERRTKQSSEVRISQVLSAQAPHWRGHAQTLQTSLW